MKKSYWLIPFIPQTILRIFSKVIVLIFLRPKIRGLENLENLEGGFILASNHINEFDPVILLSAFPYRSYFWPVFFVAMTKENYKHKGLRGRLIYGGFLFRLLGALPAYLGVKDYAVSLRHHLEALNNGGIDYIFPEGKVNLGDKKRGAKGGIGFLAAETDRPVLPVYISGTEYNGFWSDLFLFKRKMRIVVGEPIFYNDSYEDKSVQSFKSFSQDVLNNIFNLGK